MRKQADFHVVFHYKRVYRTFEGGKAKEYRTSLYVHPPTDNARRLWMGIVKAEQRPHVGSCEAGLLKGSFWKAWAVFRETDKHGSYGAGVQQWTLATWPTHGVSAKSNNTYRILNLTNFKSYWLLYVLCCVHSLVFVASCSFANGGLHSQNTRRFYMSNWQFILQDQSSLCYVHPYP